jgi:hypothetical protein
VFDTHVALAMTARRLISNDSVSPEVGCDELRDASIACVGEDKTMVLAQRLDVGAAVVNGVVAVAATSAVDRDDAKIAAPHEHLRVAGPAVVVGVACDGVITGGDESSVHEPREPSMSVRGLRQQRCQTWTRSATMQWACDREMAEEASEDSEL